MTMASIPFRVAKDPAPTWKDLLRPARNRSGRPEEEWKNRYFFARGRQAVYWALKALSLRPGDAVLVPSFICDSVTAPILSAGCRLAYYRVAKDCSIDFQELERRIQSGARALLVVHFFGFTAPIRECRGLATRYNIPLIEDCAHLPVSVLESDAVDTFGDASIFSLRKSLPLDDGGELALHASYAPLTFDWERETPLQTLKSIWHFVERISQAKRLTRAQKSIAVPRLPRSNSLSGLNPSSETGSKPLESVEDVFMPARAEKPMSFVSRILFSRVDIEYCISRRRANYEFLSAKLGTLKGITLLYPTLPKQACPLFFPLFFESFPNAHLALREKGIPAVTWGGVRPSGLPLSEYPDAAFLYDNLVLLPVHQSLSQWELDAIVEAVTDVRTQHEFEISAVSPKTVSGANASLLAPTVNS
jgi:perosamine synthetase